jgi:hypothetical protein
MRLGDYHCAPIKKVLCFIPVIGLINGGIRRRNTV